MQTNYDLKNQEDTSKIKNKDIYIVPNKLEVIGLIASFILGFLLGFFLKNSWIMGIQGALFTTISCYMAMVDAKLHLVSDYFVLAIFGISLITVIPALIDGYYMYCLWKLIAAIVLPIPLLIGTIVDKNGGIGGGDIKFVSAASFLLGVNKGIYGLILGLLVAIIIQLVIINIKKLDKKKTRFALIPYLAFSYVIFYFI